MANKPYKKSSHCCHTLETHGKVEGGRVNQQSSTETVHNYDVVERKTKQTSASAENATPASVAGHSRPVINNRLGKRTTRKYLTYLKFDRRRRNVECWVPAVILYVTA